MFVDEKELLIRAGKGGDGAITFRREKYVPKGGPDGGDGGRGGSVYAIGKPNLHALTHLAHLDRIVAEDGANGRRQKLKGHDGKDATIAVPLGTVLYTRDATGEWVSQVEILQEDVPYYLARGGNGGWGNWHFRSSVSQSPERANPGLPGEEKRVRIVLKLIADIGLIGLPNSGKSTLLSVLSAARPKIANYPFTTLEPQLGVATLGSGDKQHQVIIADLPGLIEGASQGKGLGTAFLKHVERTRVVFHCLDSSQSLNDLQDAYRTIRRELNNWGAALGDKPEHIVFTKSDLSLPEEITEKSNQFRAWLSAQNSPAVPAANPISTVSAVAHSGLEALLTTALHLL
jgi:GTP-binding protein